MPTAVPRVLVGGCRSSGGGLHLGHAYGCFHEVKTSLEDQYFFVISDCIDAPPAAITREVSRIFVDVLSVAPFTVHVVRESRIRRELYQLEFEIERSVPFARLRDAHPHRREIKTGAYVRTISDLMFPVHQSVFLLGLGCAVACFNDDNRDVVSFAREAARRLLHQRGLSAPELPRLIERTPGRLESWDDRRMAKINRNCLGFDASATEVERFARRLVGGAVPAGKSFDESSISAREEAYARLIGADTRRMARLGGRDRLRLFSDQLWAYLEGVQEKRTVVARVRSQSSIHASLERNETAARDRITWVLERMGIVH